MLVVKWKEKNVECENTRTDSEDDHNESNQSKSNLMMIIFYDDL